MTKPYEGGISISYFITDGSRIIEPDTQHFNNVLRENTQIEIVKKLAFMLADEATQIWHLGDGHGGLVLKIIAETFDNFSLETESDKPRNKSNRKAISQGLRRTVYERDEYGCVSCGARKNLSIDHKIPVSRGGTNDLDNLQTMCMPCNLKKGTE